MRWIFQRSLMARLVGQFLFLSLLIVVLAGALGFWWSGKALEESVAERLEVLAVLGEEQLLRWVRERRRDVVFLASLPAVRSSSEDLAEPSTSAAGVDRLRRLLQSAVELEPHYREVLILSANGGRVVLSTNRESEGGYRVRDSFFVNGLSGTWVQNVYPSPWTLIPTLTISTPVESRTGEKVGVLAVHLDLGELDRILRHRAGLGESGETFLVDRYNDFVSGTRFGRDRFPRGVRSEGIDRALAGEDGSGLYRNHEGVPVLGVYRWIDELDLALLVEISEQEASGPARRIAAVILAVGLSLALLLTLGTFLLARQIARPILTMTESALRVSHGDLEATVPVSTRDEIGILGEAFNAMTGRLSRLYEDLHEEIGERRRTQEELESRNAELERFTYTVSHDLKSPLVTITGFLGFLEKDLEKGDHERVRDDLARIRSAVVVMSRLLKELLELSRVGRLVHPEEGVDLTELAREARDLVAGRIAEHGAEVRIAPELGVATVDRVRMLEVFQNLIDNAVKFAGDERSPEVEVGSRSEAGEIVLWVRDNGVGIDPRYHDKVFGLFERIDGMSEGTGVGLTLVKRIVEVHGGRIWVESAGKGKGTTFFFTLPKGGEVRDLG